MYHARADYEHSVPEVTGMRGGIHNSVTRSAIPKPTHMIGGYAQLWLTASTITEPVGSESR